MKKEAIENIQIAIKEYLAVQNELWLERDVREVEVEA